MFWVQSDSTESEVLFSLGTAAIQIKTFSFFTKFEEVLFFPPIPVNKRTSSKNPQKDFVGPINSTKNILSEVFKMFQESL